MTQDCQTLVYRHIACKAFIAVILIGLSGTASALSDQWYIGIGGGLSYLQPNPSDTGIDVHDAKGRTGILMLGRDIDDRSSGQFQLYSLGEATFDEAGQGSASYIAGDASLLYRFYDTRDYQHRGSIFGAAVYGRFGFGFLQRESDLPLSNDTPVYFGAGAGLEAYLTYHLGLRLEAFYQESDSATATVSLIGRFGGRKRPNAIPSAVQTGMGSRESPVELPTLPDLSLGSITGQDTAPVSSSPRLRQDNAAIAPESAAMPLDPENAAVPAVMDSDADGVPDALDRCAGSTPGYPVNGTGCALFSGVASQLQFLARSAQLTPAAFSALDEITRLLEAYPDTRIELVAHTDDSGTEPEQMALTRQRLRVIGLYLVRQGINQDRLLLRSFGAKRPIASNRTEDGRHKNNRIEIVENP